MILKDSLCERLKQHGLPGSRGRYDETALPFSNRGDQFHNARVVVVRRILQTDALHWIKRGQVIKQDLISGYLRILQVDLFDLKKRKVSFTFFGWANLTGND